jgi:hypothetical protein
LFWLKVPSMFFRSTLAGAILAALVGATPLFAHEGHDHDATPPALAHVSPRAEAQSDNFELVALPKGDEIEIWLDRFATNEPVEGASISIETPAGPVEATARGAGLYRAPAPWARNPGTTDLIFTVMAGADMDVLPAVFVAPPVHASGAEAASSAPGGAIPSWIAVLALLGGAAIPILLRDRRRLWAPILAVLLVALLGYAPPVAHEGHDEAAAPVKTGADRPGVTADGTVFLPKPSQRILAARTEISQSGEHALTVDLPGRVIPDPSASGVVTSATAGRLSAPPQGFPHLGQSVKKGDVLAYVTIPLLAVDRPTLHQLGGDLDQQISIVERRLARQQELIKTQSVAQATLDDTRLEIEGLRRRRASIEKGLGEPEPLVAPIDGVIASANAVAGQIADPNSVIFLIADPSRLWIEAQAFEPKALNGAATAQTTGGKIVKLDYIGSGLADRNQAVPVQFAARGGSQALRLGQFVTVSAATSETRTGVALPRASVVRRANGQTIVLEHARAELFAPREVRVEPLDGDNVLVVAGLEPGKRIVTQAAALIEQVK